MSETVPWSKVNRLTYVYILFFPSQFQSGSNVVGRKRKERGSLSEEVKLMEPSPVKRKYGDRLSTSSEEETLEEVLRDYKSEEDPDYVPDEHEMEESSDELEETSKESGNEQDRNESIHECLELSQGLQDASILSLMEFYPNQ